VDLTTQTVLLVDDCLEDQTTYRRYLLYDKRHSYRILEARTGEEGLLLCKQQFPDVILLDYLLPDLDGLEFLEELKNQFDRANFPVIMLTGQGNEQIAVQAIKRGAAEYLVKKDLTPESLRLAIQYTLEQQASQSSREQAQRKLQQARDELEIRVKQRTEELKRISTALSLAVEGISQLDCQGCYLMVNQAYANTVGYTPEEMVGMQWQLTVHPEDLEMMAAAYRQMLSVGKVEVEARGIRKDGSIFYKQLVMIADYDEQKQLTGHYCFMKDISERQAALRDRKQAQEKMREQAALLDIASDAIFVRDLEHRILFWNSGAERLYGWTAAEIVGKKASELLCFKITERIEEILKTVLESGSWQGELQKSTKFGQEAIVSSRMTLVRDEAGRPKSILTVDTDITEKKQLEAQFYQAQRLESLGTLASGIAHDMNNILTPILAFAQLLPLKLPNLDQQNRRLLEILTDNAKRGAQLVRQILLFSREEPEKRVVLGLENLLEEIERIVKETFPKSIALRCDRPTEAELWKVSADSTQIYQVFVNLCVNARDAMPNGGILTISAQNQVFDRNNLKMNLEAKIGNYVVITISDTGCGMSPQVKERIFEPFFTTKESGKGTGLGLSSAIGIVKNHGGFVNVQSAVEQGSQFQVWLPAIDTEATPESSEFQIVRGNGELILVVDDEPSIREMTKTSLLTYNYNVLTASDGVEALSIYEQHKDAIAVVLMDMQMPSMNGLKVISILRQINPELKIIAISGLASNRKLLKDFKIEVQAFLFKPYTIEELLDTIRLLISSKVKYLPSNSSNSRKL
jgi:PAS domain S-box-containing protein